MFLRHIHPRAFKRLALAILCVAVVGGTDKAAAQESREASLTAAMIYNFARFTTWPEEYVETAPSFQICANGDTSVFNALKGLEAKSIKDMQLAVHDAREAKEGGIACHIQLIDAVVDPSDEQKPGTLYVATHEGLGADKMASLTLIRVGRQTRFIANPDAAKQSDVQLSSKLLDLAIKVW
ncbi:MAG: YfiR family protein [Pseudomonadota bacterium]